MWCNAFSSLVSVSFSICLLLWICGFGALLVKHAALKNSTNTPTQRRPKTASHPGSSHPSPRGQCYRNSRPVAPASLHPHRSTIWACPSPPRSPHRHPSPPPARTSPYAAPCQEKPQGSLSSLGSACRTPYVKEREVEGSASLEKGIQLTRSWPVVHADISPTTLFTDLDGHKGDASSHVLESQVEALKCHRAHLPDLGIEAKNAIAEIRLCEALVRCDGVHLKANR